ncbi:MAG: S41 family peptidase [Candidatus Babeliales bacterium]|nr:S41 family peptidase [Candidatus Babeliales bacterium]
MKKKIVALIIGCLFVCQAGSLNKEEKKDPVDFDQVIYNWSRTFAEVLAKTNQKHYKVTDLEQCMIKAIDGFLGSLDPHSSFLDPKTYKQILEMTGGEFFGIGIVIDNTRQPKDKSLTVIDTMPDGPADKAGLKPYDKIVEVSGEPLEGMTTDEATAKLKGERNTKVHVKILREGQSDLLSFDIMRDVVKEQNSLAFYIPEHNVSYISLNMFTETALKQIAELLELSKKKKYKALILDLRNNSGGSLSAAVDIAGLFIDKGSLVVTTKDKTNKVTDSYITSRDPIVPEGLPIFILINNYTASAAEILAGVLKIHSEKLAVASGNKPQKKLMVFLVGTKTFGKGSVQEVMPVSNNCAIKITTSLYYLPNDTSIQGVGIEPDFNIEKRLPPTEQMVWFTKFYGRERALTNYIKVDANHEEETKKEKAKKEADEKKDKEKKTWSERARTLLETDNQLRDTISLINMLYTGKASCAAQVSNRNKAVEFLKNNFITNDSLTLEEIKI